MFREKSPLQFSERVKAKENAEKAQNLGALTFVWSYLKVYKLRLFFASMALVLAGLTVLGIGHGLKIVVDQGLAKGDGAFLNNALFALSGVVVVLALASFFRIYLITWLGEKVINQIRHDVFHHLLYLDVGWFESRNTGELISRMTNDATLLQTVVGTAIPIALRNLILLVGGVIMMLISSSTLTGIVALVIPLIIIPVLGLGPIVRQRSKNVQEAIGQIGAKLDESLHAVRDIKVFTREGTTIEHFRSKTVETFERAIRYVRVRALLSSSVIVIVMMAIGIILWYGGHQVINGSMTAGELSAFVFYALLSAGSIGAISDIYGDLLRAAGASERLQDLLAERPIFALQSNAKKLNFEQLKGHLRFDHIGFSYPTRPTDLAISDFSLEIKAGERVAVVGPSGAGKSTLFGLILRLYAPQTGSIRFDDENIHHLDMTLYRGLFGLVPQDPVIFSGSAYENIAFGHAEPNKDRVERAAIMAQAHDFIEELPQKYDTPLGERGVRLSGGQAQRIAIARAIIRDPKILLLDEATSNLDTESEKKVQKALEELMKNRTTLIIAHRLSTVKNADRIVVMDKGQIVATGTHKDLLKKSDLYKRLASEQLV